MSENSKETGFYLVWVSFLRKSLSFLKCILGTIHKAIINTVWEEKLCFHR